MAHGYYDFTTWAGRSTGGVGTVNYSFIIPVGPGATVGVALPGAAAGFEYIWQYVCISCLDNTAIHEVVLNRAVDAWVFFYSNFITALESNFPGQGIGTGTNAQLIITNNAAVALNFIGTVAFTTKTV